MSESGPSHIEIHVMQPRDVKDGLLQARHLWLQLDLCDWQVTQAPFEREFCQEFRAGSEILRRKGGQCENTTPSRGIARVPRPEGPEVLKPSNATQTLSLVSGSSFSHGEKPLRTATAPLGRMSRVKRHLRVGWRRLVKPCEVELQHRLPCRLRTAHGTRC